ncbi:MAG: tetratricopeptide repeat protein [Acidobacteria bacterium]|nr:tetratricopeptide repeat protein [Acidobacteriota bacterium]
MASKRRAAPAPFSEAATLMEPPDPPLTALRARRGENALFLLHKLYRERADDFTARLERVAPHSTRLLQIRGLNAEYADDFKQAETHYRQALAGAPETPGLHFSLGHVLRQLGQDDEADSHLANEVEKDGSHYLVWFERGLIRARRGEDSEAAVYFERALAVQPDFEPVEVELAKSFLQTTRYAEALKLLQRVAARSPGHPSVHFLLARAYKALGRQALASRELETHRTLLQKGKVQSGPGPGLLPR